MTDIQDAAKDKANQRPLNTASKAEKKPPITPAARIPTTTQSLKGVSSSAIPASKSSNSKAQAHPASKTAPTKEKTVLIQELDDSPTSPPEPPRTIVPVPKNEPMQSRPTVPPASPLQPLQPSTPLPHSEITLSSLEKLLRQSSTNTVHKASLNHTLFNLDASSLPRIFGPVGLDSSFLTAFLDAILAIPERDTKWIDQSIALLDGLRKCGRFGIAMVFVPGEKWKGVFDEVEKKADAEQRKRLETVKSFWVV